MNSKSKKKVAPTLKLSHVIGLDIGATNCRISAWSSIGDKPEVIADELGNKRMPSVIAIQDIGVSVGQGALGILMSDSHHVFTGIIDLLRENPEGKRLSVKVNGEDRFYSPKDLLTHLLSRLKDVAHQHLGKEVIDTVIAVPGWLSDNGRQAVRNASADIGINVLRIIQASTSACIAYDLDKKYEETRVLVLDMGGSSFSISVLLIEDGIFETVHSITHSDVSGNKFDERFAEFLLTEYDRKNKTNLHDDARVMRRMRTACSKAKECLSTSSYTHIIVQNLHNDKDYENSVTKASFEKVNFDLFQLAIHLIEEALKQTCIRKEEVKHVVLAGGSTKIPKLSKMIEELLPESVIEKAIDQDHVVSFGCTKQAMILAGHKDSFSDLLLLDVEPLSLGLETADGIMAMMIPRNSTIPCKRTTTFTTYHDNQVTMMFRVFEGERCFTKENSDLGMFEMTGIRAERRGRARIDVTFDIDANGVLTITAVNKASKKSQSCTLTNFKAYYDQHELEEILEIAEDNLENDEKKMSAITVKHTLISLITNLEVTVEHNTNIHESVREHVMTKCRELFDWVAKTESADSSVYEDKMAALADELVNQDKLGSDLVNQCRNDRLQFVGGRVVDMVATKPKGLARGWRRDRTGKVPSHTPVVQARTSPSGPAVEEVD